MDNPAPPPANPSKSTDPVAPHPGPSSALPAVPPVPAPAVPPVPAPAPALVIGKPKPKLTAKEKAKAKAAYADLKAHLAEVDPEHPKTGIAGILPPWLALILKQFGPAILALIEAELGIPPGILPPRQDPTAPAPAPAPAPAATLK